ncbi:glycosyltransferase family 2 protein [Microbacterium rhizosphaerae]|uniref:Glycosyltransferase n=1 Tax=Microbacterium rhizosphaerae TaxID=1678237 RepID=A0ABZ0SK55_9MICO|nr:glycosyltransferase [Microbacterium rhizosphaerae]WPR89759.1 glycosyltransferase [Microbacterium rhizosphaerae]
MPFDYDVVIPTLGNRPALLDQSIASALGQTLPPARVIVVVDGDLIAAAEIKQRWPAVDVVAVAERSGTAAARQRGIESCSATWVTFLDDDDLWAKRKMAVTADYLERHSTCQAVRAVYWIFAEPGDPINEYGGQNVDMHGTSLDDLERAAIGMSPANDFEYLRIQGDSLGLLLERNRGVISTTCVRRSLLEGIPAVPPTMHAGEDHVLFCLIATRAEWHLIDEPLLFYRVHSAQYTRTGIGMARGIIQSRVTAWELCGDAAPRSLGTYGWTYRREFRPFLWAMLRPGKLVEAFRTWTASFQLLPYWTDRALLLIPEPVVWRWDHRVRRITAAAGPKKGYVLDSTAEDRPRLSVCVVTYERPTYLERCLRSLDENVSDDVEIVVVDASKESAEALVAGIRPSAIYVHAPQLAGWMTRSRNEALKRARGDVISFLDDDVVVSAQWQAALLAAYDDPSVSAVAGRTRNLQPGEDVYDQPVGRLRQDGSLTEGFASIQPPTTPIDHGIGANMSFRRRMLARLGGFRDDYPGTAIREDTDIFLRVKRAGGRAVFATDAVVDHLPAPHVHGARFDLRYKLYARRNHMVLLARYDGIRSRMLRRWIVHELRSVRQVAGLRRKAQRLVVITIGIGWGAAAMIRQAHWTPMDPARGDPLATQLRLRMMADAPDGH